MRTLRQLQAQATREVIRAVAMRIEAARKGGQLGCGVVVDPVMVTANGDKLIDDDAVEAICQHLLPLATLATPNRREAALLLGSATCVLILVYSHY